jgi:hypothetical protein
MVDSFTLVAFRGTIKDAGRDYPEEMPFDVQKASLKDHELCAYNAIIDDIRSYGCRKFQVRTSPISNILHKGHGEFLIDHASSSRMVFGRYAVIDIDDKPSGILVLFIGSNLKGTNTIEMIGLRRFKPFKDGTPNYETITHVIAPMPKHHNDGF